MSNAPLYMIFYDLERIPGDKVIPLWPFHMTIVPWFRCESLGEPELISIVTETGQDVGPVSIQRSHDDVFDGSVAVSVISSAEDQLEQLHKQLIGRLVQAGCVILDERWVGNNYRPHIAHKRVALPRAFLKRRLCTDISLAKRSGQDHAVKSIVARIPLTPSQ